MNIFNEIVDINSDPIFEEKITNSEQILKIDYILLFPNY